MRIINSWCIRHKNIDINAKRRRINKEAESQKKITTINNKPNTRYDNPISSSVYDDFFFKKSAIFSSGKSRMIAPNNNSSNQKKKKKGQTHVWPNSFLKTPSPTRNPNERLEENLFHVYHRRQRLPAASLDSGAEGGKWLPDFCL